MNKKICPKILGIVLVSIIINLTLTSKAIAATYYVDSTDGLDTNNGTSESTPWQTINKVNTSTFNPGDNILFKKGRIWREILSPPSSGTSDNLITFGNYGSGNNPAIYRTVNYTNWNEASIIKNGNFERYVGTQDDSTDDTFVWWAFSKGDATANVLATTDAHDGLSALQLKRNTANSALRGVSAYVEFNVTPGQTYYLEYWGKKESTAYEKVRIYDYTPALFLKDDGSWTTGNAYLTALEVTESTWTKKSLTFTVPAGTTHIFIEFLNHIGSGSTDTGLGSCYVDSVYLAPGVTKPTLKVWEATYANHFLDTYSKGMVKDGIRMPLNTSMLDPNAVFTTLQEGIYYAPSLFWAQFYRQDSGKPANTELGIRLSAIAINNVSNIKVDGIDVYGPGGGEGTSPSGHLIDIWGTASNITIKNLNISNGYGVGIWAENTTSNVYYENINSHNNSNTGIYMNSQGGHVVNSKSYNNCNVNTDTGDCGGIGIFQGGNIDVLDNETYDNGLSNVNSDFEISVVDVTNPVRILRNYTHDCGQGCIQVGHEAPNSEISYNIIDGFGTATSTPTFIGAFSGIRVMAGYTGWIIENLKIYNNVFVNGSAGTNNYRHAITIAGVQTNNTKIKNNIFYNNGSSDIYVSSDAEGTGFEIDNNIYSKSDYTNNWNWKGTNYSSLAAWSAARGFDTNSSTNNPDFVNAGSSDYRLKSTSWGIDRGIDVGLLLDKNGVTVPQGEGVDIGAYELSGSFSEVGTTDDAKDNGIKLRSPKKDEYKNDKTPKFRFRKMDDSSIEKYQVLVKEKKSGKEYVYIDDITPNGGKKEEDDNKKVWYKNDEIEVESKTKLKNMEYKWWVKAKNNLEQLNKSEERKLHIDTTKPLLTITKIGNRILKISEIPTTYILTNGKVEITGVLNETGTITIKDENNIEVCNTETLDNKTFKCSITTKNKLLTITAIDKAKNETLPISITRR